MAQKLNREGCELLDTYEGRLEIGTRDPNLRLMRTRINESCRDWIFLR
jgi:hypothetical protein